MVTSSSTANAEVEISIVQADALGFGADVLVLKHAQALYGVDAQVVRRLDGNRGGVFAPVSLPPVGEVSLVDSRGLLGAKDVLFVGVEPLGRFGYAEIRAFARRSLTALAEKVPDATHVATTLHGVGFGLDETEAFRSQLAGLIEAWQSGECPPTLRQVSIVEHDGRRGERLRSQLEQILPKGLEALASASKERSTAALQTEALKTAGAGSSGKAHVFVAMPFAKEFDDRFHYGIHKAIQTAGYLCERADMSSFTGDVLAWVKERIDSAALVVADLSGGNANVYLEVGYAWGKGLPTVLVASEQKDLLFDVRGQRCLIYDNSIRALEEHLTRELRRL
jgi:hypothetical protein